MSQSTTEIPSTYGLNRVSVIQTIPTTEHEARMSDRLASMIKKQSSKTIAVRFVIGTFLSSLIICIIWFIYWPKHFGFDESYTKTDLAVNGIYYWSTVTSTVGFGDICPKTINSKLFTVFYQMFITVVGIGLMWELTDEAVNFQIRSNKLK